MTDFDNQSQDCEKPKSLILKSIFRQVIFILLFSSVAISMSVWGLIRVEKTGQNLKPALFALEAFGIILVSVLTGLAVSFSLVKMFFRDSEPPSNPSQH